MKPWYGFELELRRVTPEFVFLFGRFVQFVITPAVLEWFVSLEKEILQIENSVLTNDVSKTDLDGRQVEGMLKTLEHYQQNFPYMQA